MSDALITYAQNREDLYLFALLGHIEAGFYVDIGANHPVTDSVTEFFYERGWNGINVEPNVDLHVALGNDRPRDINVNVGVSDQEGRLRYRHYPRHAGLSTFSGAIMDLHAEEDLPYEDIEVDVVTLAQLLAEHEAERIDFMKIDVEGFERRVLSGNDWQRFRPKVLVIEGGAIDDWEPVLTRESYTREFFDGLNYYYLADEEVGHLSIMNYAPRVLSRVIYSHREVSTVRALESEITAMRSGVVSMPDPVRRGPTATLATIGSRVLQSFRR